MVHKSFQILASYVKLDAKYNQNIWNRYVYFLSIVLGIVVNVFLKDEIPSFIWRLLREKHVGEILACLIIKSRDEQISRAQGTGEVGGLFRTHLNKALSTRDDCRIWLFVLMYGI